MKNSLYYLLTFIIVITIFLCIEQFLIKNYNYNYGFTDTSQLGPASYNSQINIDQFEYQYVEKYNEFGFREKKIYSLFSNINRSSRQNIIFIGDSFVAGEGISDDSRFSNIIKKKISSKNNTEVINLGQMGTNPEQYLKIAYSYAINLSPKVIFLGIFTGNDFRDANKIIIPNAKEFDNLQIKFSYYPFQYIVGLFQTILGKRKLYKKIDSSRPFFEIFFREKINKSFYLKKTNITSEDFDEFVKTMNPIFVNESLRGRINPSFLMEALYFKKWPQFLDQKVYSKEDIQMVVNCINNLNSYLKTKNVELFVLIFPSDYEVYPNKFTNHWIETAFSKLPNRISELPSLTKTFELKLKNNQIPYFNFLKKFQSIDQNLYYNFDGHLNFLAQQIVANEIFNILKNRFGVE